MNLLHKILIFTFLKCIIACLGNQEIINIDDSTGILGKTNAPVSIEIKLNKYQKTAAEDGRLRLIELKPDNKVQEQTPIPIQIEFTGKKATCRAILIMPKGEPGIRRFKLVESDIPIDICMNASVNSLTGQPIITEKGEIVLQYNYQTVFEEDVIRLENERLEKFTRTEADTFLTVSIYAVPRSNYIHPLYGLSGEMLTRDWPEGPHPHHRGIFWAWPEVKYGSETGDPYALQTIFVRPSDKIDYSNGPVFAQLTAVNLWLWEDEEPIVREYAVIRVYRSTPSNRVIDLTLKFDALKEGITIATRDTDSYGGLCLRMQFPEHQVISFFTEADKSKPVRAWSDFGGIFEGAESPSGLKVLQHQNNPDYPGKWVAYPELAWVQPTFPASGTRYLLDREESLILNYRLVVYSGDKPEQHISESKWDAFHDKVSPLSDFIFN